MGLKEGQWWWRRLYVTEYEGGLGLNSSRENYERQTWWVCYYKWSWVTKKKDNSWIFFNIMLIYIILLIDEWDSFVSESKIYIVCIDDLNNFSV